MNTTLRQYNETNHALESNLGAVPADSWSEPSPCEGWTARDVVGHMVQTQRDFLTERGLALGTAPDVDRLPSVSATVDVDVQDAGEPVQLAAGAARHHLVVERPRSAVHQPELLQRESALRSP